jgi:hypothetical protein
MSSHLTNILWLSIKENLDNTLYDVLYILNFMSYIVFSSNWCPKLITNYEP